MVQQIHFLVTPFPVIMKSIANQSHIQFVVAFDRDNGPKTKPGTKYRFTVVLTYAGSEYGIEFLFSHFIG